jgi:hypothetical protein
MRAAIATAPTDRLEWCAAIKAELDVISDRGGALAWAWGAFRTALGWRIRVEAPFLALLMVIPPLEDRLHTGAFFWLAHRLPGSVLFSVLGAFEAVLLFALTLGLTLFRPKLAALSTVVVAFVGPSGLICWPHVALSSNFLSRVQAALDSWVVLMVTQPDNPALNTPHVHNWQLLAILLWARLGPCVYGAVVGLGLAVLVSRLGGLSRRTRFT